jgi:hypothetical protein
MTFKDAKRIGCCSLVGGCVDKFSFSALSLPVPLQTSALMTKTESQITASIRSAVAKVMTRTIETKQSVHTLTDGMEIAHNRFVICDGNLLETIQGVGDPLNSTGMCTGDNITVRGIIMK